ncbi:MAG: 50S ribosomal protein L29 [Acidobacteria bacterium]|nr:50S ribosomal protein L29 [Acidobacteriota bacterium]
MSKAIELRELDSDALQSRVKELDEELFRMRIKKSMGQLETSHQIRNARRELARIQTVLKEKAK